MSRSHYILKRIGHALLVVGLTYLLVWTIIFLMPGDPVRNRLDNPQNPVPPEVAEHIIRYYELDRSGLEQLLLSVTRLFQGDLGYSLTNGIPVTELLAQGIQSTFLLAALGLAATLVISAAVALAAVFAPWGPVRRAAAVIPLLSLSAPTFLVGLLLLQVFAYQLGWFSSIRDEGLKSLLLPAVNLGIAASPPITRVLIQGLSDAQRKPFVNVLRAKGLSETAVAAHVVKNGSIPTVTLLGLTAGGLLTGSVITEVVFSRTGLGYITDQAVRAQDGPVVLGVVMLVAGIVTLFNLLTDLLYPAIDPRIEIYDKSSGRGAAQEKTREKVDS